MKLTSIQCGNENMGVPILDAMYQGCKKILDDRYVPYIYVYSKYIQFEFNPILIFSFGLSLMWMYLNCIHGESQYAYTPNIGQNNLPNIF